MYLRDFAVPLLALPRFIKQLLVIALDICLCLLSVWVAFYLRFGEFISLTQSNLLSVSVLKAALICTALAIPIFTVSGLYNSIFRYSEWKALVTIGKAIIGYALIYSTIITVVGVPAVPRTVGIIQPVILLLFVGISRTLANFWLGSETYGARRQTNRPRVLIYGAGKTGRQFAAAMYNSHEMAVIGFLDDDDRLHGHVLNTFRIYNPDDLPYLAKHLRLDIVLLALPNLSRQMRNGILTRIQKCHVAVRTLPSLADLASGKISVSDIHELDIDDLLGREPVAPNLILLTKNISDKTVLVTGAGGSIGSELCRQIMNLCPKKLVLLEQSEFMLYNIEKELREKYPSEATLIIPMLASIQNKGRIHEIMKNQRPDTVYHAAAYKHVSLVENNPAEGMRNNAIGTLRTAQVAIETGVANFVLVSTDKAVRPTNMMGASKRLAEMILQGLESSNSKTRFSIVRFGNVLGSSGSVVPKFREQIKEGGPITLTHSEVTRFFMTIPEAAQLVIQAGAMAKGGDVFLLDMGDSIKVSDLARRMVELSGLSIKDANNPTGDIEIVVTGLRPGEKLHEELLLGANPVTTHHPRILRAVEDFLPWNQLEGKLETLDRALEVNDVSQVASITRELVQDYVPSSEIRDWALMNGEPTLKAVLG
jgi:FlaA1/EpsC-like NDP-sugar epimerase